MKKQQHRRKKSIGLLFLALFYFYQLPTMLACDTSGYIIDDLIDNGDGTFTIEMTILVAGGMTTGVGSTWGFYWDVDVPVVSVTPTSLTSSNGTTINAVITGSNITWGDPNPSAATPFLDISVSPNDESFTVSVVVLGAPTEWSGGGHEGNNCPNGPGSILENYSGVFPCQSSQIPMTTLELQTCDGGFVSYAGELLAVGTTTEFTLVAANGCDSIVTVTILGTGPELGQVNLQACEGVPLFFNGVEIPIGSTTEVLVTTPGACDSLISVTALDPVPTTFGEVFLQACENEILTYQGIEIPPGTMMEFTLTNSEGCDSMVTVTALEPLPPAMGSDTVGLCIGATVEVFGQTVTTPGIFTASFTAANGCDSVHTTIVQLEPGPLLIMPETTEIILGEEITLSPTVAQFGQVTFTWSPDPTLSCPGGVDFDCPNPVVQPVEATTYNLVVTDSEGCQTEGSVEILVRPVRRVYIPNAFSPNGDGVNDFVLVYTDGKSVARINTFRIFSRWGELVFENFNFPPNDPSYGWDGEFLGEKMGKSVFVYLAEVEFIDGEVLTYKGDVVLVR